jgi:hypothetical protein
MSPRAKRGRCIENAKARGLGFLKKGQVFSFDSERNPDYGAQSDDIQNLRQRRRRQFFSGFCP